MDASNVTSQNIGRAVFSNLLTKQTMINNGSYITRALPTVGGAGSNTTRLNQITGALNILPSEFSTIVQFATPPPPPIPGITGSYQFTNLLPNYAYITVPNTFNFGDSDFTYEWFQNQQQPGPVAIYLGLYDGGESGIIFSSDINSTTSTATITADFSSSGTITSDLPSNILLNTWAHVAVVRILSTITMYVNGNPTDSIRSSAYLNAPFGDIKIGQTQDDIEGIYCNIANFRIINGTGIYTSSFTVPSSPLTNVSNTVLLLSATDSARLNVDSSSQNNSVSTFSVAWSSDTPFS